MEELLVSIGELIATEIDDVRDIEYVDKELGYMFYLHLKNGQRILLSIVDSQI